MKLLRKLILGLALAAVITVGLVVPLGRSSNPAPAQTMCAASAYTATVYWVDHYTGLIGYTYNQSGGCTVWTHWSPWAETFLYPGACVIPSLRRHC